MKKQITGIVILLVLSLTLAFAATVKYVWKGETVIAETDGYGGAVADLAADGAWDFTANIDLETDGYFGAIITLEHDSAGTTDNIILGIFPSYDGTNFADSPITEKPYDATAGTDTQEPGYPVYNIPHFKIGVKTSGTTDTFDYQITWDAWRADAS